MSVAAMRQRVAERLTNRILEFGAAGEVTALMRGIAPRAVGIPMPRCDGELGVETVGDRTPAGGERFLEARVAVDGVEVIRLQNVDRSAEGEVGIERNGAPRGRVDVNGLRRGSARREGRE